eukprot:m.352604 g.352604  ORF g.352604 m.352604 type:complete len:368 (+) comp16561_c0_seq1:169-1272(+)
MEYSQIPHGAQMTLFFGSTSMPAQMASGLVFCDDTNDFRKTVLLATQGGRKTTASRIGRKSGRLWNLPFPEDMELMMLDNGEPAIFARPNDEVSLESCTPLQLYRRCLMKSRRGITFDLTKGKDLVCALPYKSHGLSTIWSFVIGFRHCHTRATHWFVTEETFLLDHDYTPPKESKEPKSRSRKFSLSSSRSTQAKIPSPAPVKSEIQPFMDPHFHQQPQLTPQLHMQAQDDPFALSAEAHHHEVQGLLSFGSVQQPQQSHTLHGFDFHYPPTLPSQHELGMLPSHSAQPAFAHFQPPPQAQPHLGYEHQQVFVGQQQQPHLAFAGHTDEMWGLDPALTLEAVPHELFGGGDGMDLGLDQDYIFGNE